MKKLLIIFFCLFLMVGATTIHAEDNTEEVISYEELKGKKVGIQTGSILDRILPNIIEDVQIVYYESLSDMREALLSGKVDAISADEPKLRYMAAIDSQIVYRKDVFEYMEYAFIFNKDNGKALCNEFNQYVKKIKDNGFLDEMINDWFDPKQNRDFPDYESLPNKNGVISYAIDAQLAPFCFVKDGKYAGLEVEIMTRFCEERGYALEITNVQFASLTPGVYSGKYNIASSCITITDERKQSVLFSDPTYIGGSTIAIKKDSDVPSYTDYAQKSIAILTGSSFSGLVDRVLPEAKKVFLDTTSDTLLALKTNKVDATVLDEPVARSVVAQDHELMIADGYLDKCDFAYAFAKNEEGKKMCDDISSFVQNLKESGKLEQLQNKWFDSVPSESLMEVNPNELKNINGTLRVGGFDYPPFVIQGKEMVFGYDIDILALFALENGYDLEFVNLNSASLIAALQSNKCNIATTALAVTEERAEQVYFSEPNYSGGVVLAIRRENTGSESFLNSLIDSFNKTFIREDRYKLFLQGIGTTLLITLLSVLFGTILGFIIFLLCHKGNVFANWLAKLFSTIMTGLPIVVLLMILYYVVFGNSSISGAAVSIIGFSLVFSAEVFSMMNNAVKAVDYGQNEAAYALGYGYWSSFFRYILPQAIPHFLPPYRGSLVSLVKATAIVGYVAVQDLTKMGDIVRSRTYEAFFPLIAIAIIYFVLGRLLVFIINRLTIFLDPSRRSKKDILKGIETHD